MNTYKLGVTNDPIRATEIMFDDIKSTVKDCLEYSVEETDEYVQALSGSIEHYINHDSYVYYHWKILEI